MKLPLSYPLVIIFSLLTCSQVFGQKKITLDNASFTKGVSPLPKGPFPPTKAIKATYDLTWKGSIRAGSATVTLRPNPNNPAVVQGTATGKSTGLAGKLFPYQFTYRSTTHLGQNLSPQSASLKQNSRKSKTDSSIKFTKGLADCTRQVTEHKTGTSKNTRRNFISAENLTQDAFASLLGGRNLALTQGQEITSLIIPVDQPYLIRLKVLGRETRKIKKTSYKTIKLDLKIVGKVNDNLTIKTYDKVKSCTVWLSDDAERIPLELKADIFVGHMSVLMTHREYIQ